MLLLAITRADEVGSFLIHVCLLVYLTTNQLFSSEPIYLGTTFAYALAKLVEPFSHAQLV
jgi:hypothetical protein